VSTCDTKGCCLGDGHDGPHGIAPPASYLDQFLADKGNRDIYIEETVKMETDALHEQLAAVAARAEAAEAQVVALLEALELSTRRLMKNRKYP